MTDNEIIKALECCSEVYGWCLPENRAKCPLYGYNGEDEFCDKHLSKSALGIIKRQKAEIERLQKANESFSCLGKMYSEIKSEARKEFAERLKKEALIDSGYEVLQIGTINKLLTEMEERE